MLDLEPFFAELRGHIADAWPDVVKADGGRKIYEHEHVSTIPLEELISAHGLPYAVIVTPQADPTGPLDEEWLLLSVEVYYLAQTATGAAPLRPKALAMAHRLYTGAFTEAQMLPEPAPRPVWSLSLPINMTLRQKKLPALAAGAQARFQITEPA